MPRRIDRYKRTPACAFCKSRTSWFVAKDRLAKNRPRPCLCDAYHFPHRKNSGDCRPGRLIEKEIAYRKSKREIERAGAGVPAFGN